MAKIRENARIWGAGLEGGVWHAPKGTTPPTWTDTITEPADPWLEFGWLGDDTGVEFEQSTDSESFKGWPGGIVLRRVTTNLERSWTFVALEETASVLGFVHPGLTFAEVTPASGLYKGTVPENHVPVESAGIFFFQDGPNYKAAVCPAVLFELTSSVAHKFDDLTGYEFKATTLGEYDIYVVPADGSFLSA